MVPIWIGLQFALNWRPSDNILNKTNKLKLYEDVVVTLFYLCCFLFVNFDCEGFALTLKQFTAFLLKSNGTEIYYTVPQLFIASCCHFTFFRALTGIMTAEEVVLVESCFCAFSLQSLYYYTDVVSD